MTFDACDEFAQAHVDYVLTDLENLPNDCLLRVDSFPIVDGELAIYKVQ